MSNEYEFRLAYMLNKVNEMNKLAKQLEALEKFKTVISDGSATGLEITIKFGAREEFPLAVLNPKETLDLFSTYLLSGAVQAIEEIKNKLEAL